MVEVAAVAPRREFESIALVDRPPTIDEGKPAPVADGSSIHDPASGQLVHIGDGGPGRAGQVERAPRGEECIGPRPGARPDVEMRAGRRREGSGKQQQRNVRPDVVQSFTGEGDGQSRTSPEDESVQPRAHQGTDVSLRIPGRLRRRVHPRVRVQTIGGRVVRTDELMRDQERRVRRRCSVRCVPFEIESSDPPSQLSKRGPPGPQLAKMVGDAELRLVRLADVRGAAVGSWLRVRPAPREEPGCPAPERRPREQSIVEGDRLRIELCA